MKGIDISEFNGIIDFNKVSKEVDFVMIRATFGKKEDKMFRRNAKGCVENSIPFGFYFYSYALNEKEAKEEVSYFLTKVGEYKNDVTFPLAIDMEDSDSYKKKNGFPTNAMLCNICQIACDEIAKAGYIPIIYANLDWFTHYLTESSIDRYYKWLAWWSQDSIKKVEKSKYQMLQYSCIGKIEGIGGNVDINESFTEFNKLKKYIDNLKKMQEIKLYTGIEDITIQFISLYKFGEFLLNKIYERVKEPRKIKDKSKDIHKVVKEEYCLEDKTIKYMESYIYAEHLFLKLYRAICEKEEK